MTQPRHRTALQREVLAHQQILRHTLALGERPTLRRNLRMARERLGLTRLRDLPALRHGSIPGPGRPFAETAASVGRGIEATSSAPIAFGEPLELGGTISFTSARPTGCGAPRPRAAGSRGARRGSCSLWSARPRPHCCWRFKPTGLLSDAPSPPADGRRRSTAGPRRACDRGRLRSVGGVDGPAARGARRPERSRSEAASTRFAARRHGSVSATTIAAWASICAASIVREPRSYAPGEHLSFGSGSGDVSMLAGGWNDGEPEGRWTSGPLARLLLRGRACDDRELRRGHARARVPRPTAAGCSRPAAARRGARQRSPPRHIALR